MAGSTIGFDLEGCIGPLALSAPEAAAGDDAIVKGLKAGEEAAYETLLATFQQPVYSLVYRLLNDPGDSCDVVQEVFLKVFRNIDSFRGQSSLKTWIYRIAVNEAYNHRRWFVRHKKQEVGIQGEEDCRSYQDILPDPGLSPFEVALDHEHHRLIGEALEKLNPVFRAAVILRDVEDLSYEEIAEVLHVSLGTVKSRILRGRESLRKMLAERLETAPGASWVPPRAGGMELESVES